MRTQFQLKVTLRDVQPSIWRRFLVPADIMLPRVHAVIQVAFGWTNSHLHAFRVGNKAYEAYYPESWNEPSGCDEKIDERRYKLSTFLKKTGDQLLYNYDYGDDWEVDIELEKILPATKTKFVFCLDGARAGPPDDCGGPLAYQELVESMTNRRHPQRKMFLEWMGGPYDTENFDLARINSQL